MLRPAAPFALTLVAGLLAACEANQLYIAHDTVIGLNAAVNTQRTAGRLMFGYERDFVTLIPRSVPQADGGEARDAMAALSCSQLETDGIFLTRYVESLATGTAATEFAKALRDGEKTDLFRCDKPKPQ